MFCHLHWNKTTQINIAVIICEIHLWKWNTHSHSLWVHTCNMVYLHLQFTTSLAKFQVLYATWPSPSLGSSLVKTQHSQVFKCLCAPWLFPSYASYYSEDRRQSMEIVLSCTLDYFNHMHLTILKTLWASLPYWRVGAITEDDRYRVHRPLKHCTCQDWCMSD